jgi:hypothetical protein
MSSGEGRETPILLGPLVRANLSHWTWSLPSPAYGNRSSFRNVFLYLESRTMDKSRMPVILSAMHQKSTLTTFVCFCNGLWANNAPPVCILQMCPILGNQPLLRNLSHNSICSYHVGTNAARLHTWLHRLLFLPSGNGNHALE